MFSTSSSVRARKARRKYRHQKDVCATFDTLREEKRRLLHLPKDQDQQLMNNLNERQHRVVQRMSAFDRYKRIRSANAPNIASTTTAAAPAIIVDSTTPPQQQQQQQHLNNDTAMSTTRAASVPDQEPAPSPPPPQQERAVALTNLDLLRALYLRHSNDSASVRDATLREYDTLVHDMETHIDTSNKLVTLLRQGQLETMAEQLGELDRSAPAHLRLLILHVQKVSREYRQGEREANEDATPRGEQQQHQRVEEERARQQQEIEDSYQAKKAHAHHQLLKTRADRKFRLEWLASHTLIRIRRATQVANAG